MAAKKIKIMGSASMARKSFSPPLQEKIYRKKGLKIACDFFIVFLLLSLLLYRLLHLQTNGPIWLLAFLCESWFTFIWLLNMNTKWSPVEHRTYPDRLLHQFEELPPVDMFVTTADSTLEPPAMTVDTVLSLMAVDYPAQKLACYVSDDGCSPVVFYALLEASKFARKWVPFCKKYKVGVRAPSFYFSNKEEECPQGNSPPEFVEEWRKMKGEYEELSRKIEEAVENSTPFHLNSEFEDFVGTERGNHPPIVKVIVEKSREELPSLIYVAREKRPKCPHHYKAGAMNVLTRVSGVMTNAPFMLNVDCDMFVNNPAIILHAMCLLLGSPTETESGFVQSPQVFHGLIKDDPFGNHLVVLQQALGRGVAGIQGPFYGGTGCFHRRKVIYGQHPQLDEINETNPNLPNDQLLQGAVEKKFGQLPEMVASVIEITSSVGIVKMAKPLSTSIDAAVVVASCRYEFNTCWGDEIGLVYGSATEDVLTGLKIHSMGWKSVYCTPDPPAFLGCAPTGGPSSLTQQKRWATGLLEILFHKYSPLHATFSSKLQFRMCWAYMILIVWAPRAIPELCYSLLVAHCLLNNTSFLPKVTDSAMLIPATLFAFYHFYTLSEYISCKQSIRAWWNNQRMARITSATAWLFAIFSVLLKQMGLSEALFELTRKDQNATAENAEQAGMFTFDSSPLFVTGTTLVFVHVTALVVALSRLLFLDFEQSGAAFGEIICSAWLLLNFLPFLKGLFRRGKYGIPWPTTVRAAALAFIFYKLCTSNRSLFM